MAKPSIETRFIDHGFFKNYKPRPRPTTDRIIVHCAATPATFEGGAREIHKWHCGKGWAGIGYHYVVGREGTIEVGRKLEMAGAHAEGFNARSVSICLMGGVDADGQPEDNFTIEQKESLRQLIVFLRQRYPGAVLMGHRDLPNVKKACPSFDVRDWARKEGL